MKRPVVVVAMIVLTVVGLSTAAPAQAAKCTPGLATAVGWDHTDPQYMLVVPTVTWQNCKGAIRKVVMETRAIDDRGGLAGTTTTTFTADVVHKPNGTQTYRRAYRVDGWATSQGGFGGFANPETTGSDILKSCVQGSKGNAATGLNGVTFYNVATAYDKKGRKILQKISPPVVCDQNG